MQFVQRIAGGGKVRQISLEKHYKSGSCKHHDVGSPSFRPSFNQPPFDKGRPIGGTIFSITLNIRNPLPSMPETCIKSQVSEKFINEA